MFFLKTYAEMDPTTAALEKEHEAVSTQNYCERRYFHVYTFLRIYINGQFRVYQNCILSRTGSLGYYKNNFQGVHIFADI